MSVCQRLGFQLAKNYRHFRRAVAKSCVADDNEQNEMGYSFWTNAYGGFGVDL